ncbi:CRISPR-associated endonuclease Cas2 [Limnoraphis robusta Tam1]|uniref:CRISPR-associated endonuclease Cas2 n=1 Tax=Limnoraphis robusta CCNP1315 TaxID=3110306 RepID=A0ABU5U4U5_9CYAN|nr:CRISPR-associated endonuclease Cas2 [Limnoraphis robusta]MEA5499560.1 CRISPR-associated endonuclease Cas2 [Limnoraphis robusta BA-68 BA1]MEA5521658.1 CRISPR-associated endonuclease Cas2 [Limnoraphis robusta CCNP1315]MEA5542475.1 CRISPR-associated endonuclease Cas2 [Limnoraphis robusta Tam1]MEA5548177.1 CRISPR-associated endonuclease Cas2 [Limnoraphis robusta CCNP1324]
MIDSHAAAARVTLPPRSEERGFHSTGLILVIKPTEDSVRIYVLDAGSVRRTITYGSQKPRQEQTIVL